MNALNILLYGVTAPPAYLDPGSGSFLLQILLAAILGGGVLIKIYWRKLKALFSRKPKVDEPAQIVEDHEDERQQ
jgi:hypothetical protein